MTEKFERGDEDNIPEEHSSTPRELYKQGQLSEASGDKNTAAKLYEQAGYAHKSIQIYEAEGDIQAAYNLARKSGDRYTADRLAMHHRFPGHEFSDFPPNPQGDIIESMRIALESRLQPGATAEKLGFEGFKDRVVADIGTREGRFLTLFRELGAREVYGIDPDAGSLRIAVENGLLDKDHALSCKFQDLPPEIKNKIDQATIFNFNMPTNEQADFFASLCDILPEHGQAIITVAEDEVLSNAMKFIEPHFIIRTQRLWAKESNYPHKYLVILTKKPATLLPK